MDDKDRRFISFQVSAEEAELIEAAASREGISRSEYLRKKILAADKEPAEAGCERLLRHIIFMLAWVHNALYMMPEQQGHLSVEQLEGIYGRTEEAGLEYLSQVKKRIAEIDGQLRSQAIGSDSNHKS